jgi:hypothetical protein
MDIQAAERACIELETLRMKAPEIDEYIPKFEELCNKASYITGNTEVTYLFLKGLPKLILEDIVTGPQVGTYSTKISKNTQDKSLEAKNYFTTSLNNKVDKQPVCSSYHEALTMGTFEAHNAHST